MREFPQVMPGKPVGRTRLPRRFVVAAALAWLATGYAAIAADPALVPAASCLGERVDVYPAPLLREEGPPIRIFLKPGPPQVHLRLPRKALRVDLLPSIYADTRDCEQKTSRAGAPLTPARES